METVSQAVTSEPLLTVIEQTGRVIRTDAHLLTDARRRLLRQYHINSNNRTDETSLSQLSEVEREETAGLVFF